MSYRLGDNCGTCSCFTSHRSSKGSNLIMVGQSPKPTQRTGKCSASVGFGQLADFSPRVPLLLKHRSASLIMIKAWDAQTRRGCAGAGAWRSGADLRKGPSHSSWRPPWYWAWKSKDRLLPGQVVHDRPLQPGGSNSGGLGTVGSTGLGWRSVQRLDRATEALDGVILHHGGTRESKYQEPCSACSFSSRSAMFSRLTTKADIDFTPPGYSPWWYYCLIVLSSVVPDYIRTTTTF